MSKNSQNRILKIILATIIVVGAFGIYYFTKEKKELIPMVDIVIPQSITIDDETEVNFEWTDDNTGEDLIIQSDKQTYFGVNQSIVYFTITNINTIDQEINIRYLFEDSNASLKNIEKINQDQSTSNLTSVTKPTVRFKSMRGFTSSTNYYLDNIKSGETNYYQATISYLPNSKAEFYVEAKGKNSYGLLDPFYDSSGLVGYWSFNGEDTNWGTNTTNDLSGQGNHGTMINMSTTTSPTIGKMGQGLGFDNTNDRVDIPEIDAYDLATEFTTSAWVKLTSNPSQGKWLVAKYDSVSTGDFYGFVLTSGEKIQFRLRVGGSQIDPLLSNTTLAVGQWYHVTATYNGSNAIIYINGVLDNSVSQSGAINVGTGGIFIGGTGYLPTWGPFGGIIDEVLIYNKALTQAEITQLYNIGKHRTQTNSSNSDRLTSGLVSHWTFDGSDTDWGTNTLNDVYGSNNLTITNMSTTTSPVVGKIGQAFDFDGSDDYVTKVTGVGGIGGNNEMTISAWVKRGGIGTTDAIVFAGPSTANYNFIATQILTNNKIYVWFGNDADNSYSDFQSTSTFTDTTSWHHLVATYNAGPLKVYLDGSEIAGATSGAWTGNIVTTTENLMIGATYGLGAQSYFDGKIDEVRIYNRVLSLSEITELYEMGSEKFQVNSPNNNRLTSGLVSHWTFDGPDINWGTNTVDDVYGSNDLTDTNMDASNAVVGKNNQGLRFNGVDEYITKTTGVSGFQSASAFSVSAWVKRNSTGDEYVVSRGDTQVNYGVLYFNFQADNKFRYRLDDNGPAIDEFQTTATFTDTNWHHFVGIYNGTDIDVYVDGELAPGSMTSDTLSGTWNGGTDKLIIGARHRTSDTQSHFNGSVDDVRAYNRVLTVDEITQLYNIGAKKFKIR